MRFLLILLFSTLVVLPIGYAQTSIDDVEADRISEVPVYVVVDNAPDFPGGHKALAQYIGENLQYPAEAEANGEQGRSIVQFVVNTDGSISQERIVRSSGSVLLDAEALRIVNSLPKWIPAKIAGKDVRSYYTLPIKFELDTTIYGLVDVDNEAQYPGGKEALNQHISSTIRISEMNKELVQAKSGGATVQFVVNIDGSISQGRIISSSDSELLDAEALRIVNSLPKWIPAKMNGKNVRMYQTLAIGFNWEHLIKLDSIESSTSDTTLFIVVEKMPEFPGGQKAMMQFLVENVKYPVEAQEEGIEGRVICQFIIEKDGSVADINIVQSSGNASLDQEAMRVIQSMPKWAPGRMHGKNVRVKFTLPINFHLRDYRKQDTKSHATFDLLGTIKNFNEINLNSSYKEIIEYIQNKINYPQYALQRRIQGVTICSFTVKTDGSIVNINVDHSSGETILDKEVTHRIKSIPTKKAYQLCDESKEVSYSLLVRFEIKDMNYANHEAVVYFDVKLFYRDKLQEAIETLSRTFESKINPNRLLEVF